MRTIMLIIFLLFILTCQRSTDPFEDTIELYSQKAYQISGCIGPGSLFRKDISTLANLSMENATAITAARRKRPTAKIALLVEALYFTTGERVRDPASGRKS